MRNVKFQICYWRVKWYETTLVKRVVQYFVTAFFTKASGLYDQACHWRVEQYCVTEFVTKESSNIVWPNLSPKSRAVLCDQICHQRVEQYCVTKFVTKESSNIVWPNLSLKSRAILCDQICHQTVEQYYLGFCEWRAKQKSVTTLVTIVKVKTVLSKVFTTVCDRIFNKRFKEYSVPLQLSLRPSRTIVRGCIVNERFKEYSVVLQLSLRPLRTIVCVCIVNERFKEYSVQLQLSLGPPKKKKKVQLQGKRPSSHPTVLSQPNDPFSANFSPPIHPLC